MEVYMSPRKLVYKNYNNEEIFIKNCSTSEEVYKEIYDYLNKITDYKPSYYRVWSDGDKTVFDFGSWSEFFYLYEE